MTSAVRDSQKAKVYSAENTLGWLYDHPEAGGTVNLGGVVLQLEPEARFGDLAGIQAYVDRVTTMPAVIAAFGPSGPVRVRERKGSRKAHYSAGEIAIYTQGTNRQRWAMRELVVLHELAHHLDCHHGHGPSFAGTFVALLEIVMGPQVSLALKLLYAQEGVEWTLP